MQLRAPSPTQFGADNTGLTDSTEGMRAAIAELITHGHSMTANGEVDLGGAVLELGGGIFLVSGPIVIPNGYANFYIQKGTLKAAANFSQGEDQFILQIGNPQSVVRRHAPRLVHQCQP